MREHGPIQDLRAAASKWFTAGIECAVRATEGVADHELVQEVPVADTWWAPVRRYTHEIMAQHAIPGAALAVADGGTEVFAEGFGVREVGTDSEATPDSIFGVASVTKSFTALAVMQLADAGKLSVDDPVTRYLPSYRTADSAYARATTLHHFLTHTAGLPPLPSRFFAQTAAVAGDPFAPERPPWVAEHPPLSDAEELLAYITEQDVRPLGAPGAIFSYSNEGFVLLGTIIEMVSGQPYVDYVQEHILRPLGMERSTFDRLELAGRADVATLHGAREGDGSPTIVAAPKDTWASLWHPAGGLNSTAHDLLRYLEIYCTGGVSGDARVLSDAGVSQMLAPHTPGGDPGASYGYGLIVRRDYHGTKLVHHGGGRKGISSHVLAVPERGYAAVTLTNLADVPADRLALAPVNHLLGLPLATPFVAYGSADYSGERLSRCAGTFRGGEDTQIVATIRGGKLEVSVSGDDVVARPVGGDGVLLDLPKGESYARFLGVDQGPAWAVAFGNRVLQRV